MSYTVTATKLPGVVVIEPKKIGDERGFFMESYNRARFAGLGLHYDFVQDNHSRSAKHVLRGLHYQAAPKAQDKLVRCSAGRLLDVAVDIRASSPTLGQWVAVELSADNAKQLMVPAGYAHGFVVLSDYAELQYKVTDYYDPACEGGIAWDDPDLAIDWQVREPVLSKRDAAAASFKDYLKSPKF
jgi:dTDP-4-dehydrorhamnose 3,5-epimerase